jgi:hypothetical protein
VLGRCSEGTELFLLLFSGEAIALESRESVVAVIFLHFEITFVSLKTVLGLVQIVYYVKNDYKITLVAPALPAIFRSVKFSSYPSNVLSRRFVNPN